MIRHRIRFLVGAAATVVAVALTGCSGEDPPSEAPPESSAAGDVAVDSPIGPGNQTDDKSINMVRCLTERGWDVEVTAEGWGTGPAGIPNEQYDQYGADRAECESQFGYDQPSPPSLDQAAAEEQYDLLLVVAACIRDLGHPVSEPPSRQAYVEAAMENPVAVWHPYDDVFNSGDFNAIQQVERECPVEE